MNLTKIFDEELSKSSTNYFVIDSEQHDKDIDFETYEWTKSINNKISSGDLFIYRKPQKLSPRKEFSFTGAGKIGTIDGDDNVMATILKPHPFKTPIFQSDIQTYKWTWKKRGKSWEHFWNQYGINQIPKEDFLNILQIAEGNYDADQDALQVKQDKEIADENYYVDDAKVLSSSRPWQSAWSKRVKEAYGYKCAVCALSNPHFLISSHIIPVKDKKYKETRKDPANGICLCVLHDKAFDGGYITVTSNFQIMVSEKAKFDTVLFEYLDEHKDKRVYKPIKYQPKEEYLQYHNDKVLLR